MNSSNYVYGSNLSYLDYLQGQLYVEDIKKQNRSLIMDMSRQTRQLIASNEALAERDIQIREFDAEMIKDYLDTATDRQTEKQEQVLAGIESGFERLTYSISDLSVSVVDGINDVGAKFQWCCSKIISTIGGMNNTLKELIRIAKTPTQTAAMEHFDIARDANRRGLYSEALEELNYAINGVPGVSAGYKLEWRLYQLMGVIKLGFIDCDMSLVNLAGAEQAFLCAARYAAGDFPRDAANAYLSAGWAAYCQGKLTEAVSHTEAATKSNPDLGEAWYQLAKINMALDNPGAFNYLQKALKYDVDYALKAASDGDFQKHEALVQQFLVKANQELYAELHAEITQYIRDDVDYCQISGLESDIEAILGNRILLDYPQARLRWDDLQNRMYHHYEKRQSFSRFISNARDKINTLKQLVESPELRRINVPDRIKALTKHLITIENLYQQNKFQAYELWEVSSNELTKATRKYANELYSEASKFFTEEINQRAKTIELLDSEIEAKYASYSRLYESKPKY